MNEPESNKSDASSRKIARIAAGRFVVRMRGETANGIDVDAAVELVNTRRDDIEQIFVIHRVAEDGRLELAGIEADALTRRDCMLFPRGDVGAARRDYDGLLEFAGSTPPPCRIEMRFGHAKTLVRAHVVILIYPQACQTAVGAWLSAAPFDPGDTADGSPQALAAFEAARPQIVMSTWLEPACGTG